MSSFKQDIAKILLDKLLLGLIAAGFGFYLSRLLEDYRTKNAYRLAVLHERISACRELMSLVGIHHMHVVAVWQVLEKAAMKHPERLPDKDWKPAYDYIPYYDDFKKKAVGLTGLLSSGAMDAVIAYLNESSKVALIIKGQMPDPPPTLDSLIMAHSEFSVKMGLLLENHLV